MTDTDKKSKTPHAPSDNVEDELREYMRTSWPHSGRPPAEDVETWIVTDDWPERVPVTEEEVAVFEAWFGDLFDELFGPI